MTESSVFLPHPHYLPILVIGVFSGGATLVVVWWPQRHRRRLRRASPRRDRGMAQQPGKLCCSSTEHCLQANCKEEENIVKPVQRLTSSE